jgi:phosphoinositide-3-kinase regulatory subunit 4
VLLEQNALVSTCKPFLSRTLFDKFVKIAHVQKPDAPWPQKMIANVSTAEVEVLDLMKGYLKEVAKTMEAKMWDSKSESEPTPHIIKLDLKKDSRVSSTSKTNRTHLHGQLVSYSNEHKKSISQIATSKSYFVTGGSDCCIKIWGLEKMDFLLNSKYTLQLNTKLSNRINTVAIHEDKVCAATDKGLLYVYDMNSVPSLSQGYTIGSSLENWSNEPLEHSNGMSINVIQSGIYGLLVCGNQQGMLTGIDTRMHREVFKWDNGIQHGPITTMCWEDNWMITGTQRGYLTLWDVRYRIKVESWKVANSPIHKFGVIKNDVCPNILVCSDSPSILQLSLDTLKVVKQYKYGKEEPEVKDDLYGIKDLDFKSTNTTSCHVFDDGSFITGGSDKKVRYWNTTDSTQSNVLIGRVQDEYYSYSSKMDKGVQVIEESVQTIPSKSRIKLSLQLPSAHSDTITDLTCTNGTTVITTSRDGGLKVWN